MWRIRRGLCRYVENDAAGALLMETIRTTGNLDKDTERKHSQGVLSACRAVEHA